MLTALNLTYMCARQKKRERERELCAVCVICWRSYFFTFFDDDEGQCSSSECWPLNADDGFIFCCLAPFAWHTSRQVVGFINLQIREPKTNLQS